MNIILFDHPEIKSNLLPLTYTRPVAAIRVGIFTIAEKWEKLFNISPSFLTEAYLQTKFPRKETEENFLVNGAVFPDEGFVRALSMLSEGEALFKDDLLVAVKCRGRLNPDLTKLENQAAYRKEYPGEVTVLRQLWEIFQLNPSQVKADFNFFVKNSLSASIDDPHTATYAKDQIFIEQGAHIKAAVLNAEEGPIYIGKNAHIHEGALIKGPFALGEGAHVNMGTKIRGGCTVGPFSKVGGEINNAVILGYSNKTHDGFLGNAVIGEWCNLGAGTSNSNLKNNYADIKLWNYKQRDFSPTGLQFCGLIMGDYSKCSINTMFNTGTVTGVHANIFGAGFHPRFIPSFSWGGSSGLSTYLLDKAFETTQKVMARREKSLEDMDKNILKHIFEETKQYRSW